MWVGARAPGVIGIPQRSSFNPDWAIDVAARAARGVIHPMPVVHGGKILGVIRAESFWGNIVKFYPTPYRMTYTDYNDLIDEFVTKGKRYVATAARSISSAGIANNWYDTWTCGLMPVAATLAGAAATAVQYDDTNAASISSGPAVSTDTKHVMSVAYQRSAGGGNQGALMLVDRVLGYESCAYTAGTSQAMTNVLAAQRYISAGQPGLQASWGADTVHNATASNITVLTYTDNAGNTGQTMPTTPTVSIIVSAAASSATLGYRINAPSTSANTITWGPFLPLANGDTGMRLVADYTTSAANTGTFVVTLQYPLALVPRSTLTTTSTQEDQLFHISALERVYDGACLNFLHYGGNTQALTTFDAFVTLGWG